jgi:hypothetical protein
MGDAVRAGPAGEQHCRACGISLLSHRRCSGCGILIGPSHVETSLQLGLCSTCARRESWLKIDQVDLPPSSDESDPPRGEKCRRDGADK